MSCRRYCQTCKDAAKELDNLLEDERRMLWWAHREVQPRLEALADKLRESGTLREEDGSRSIFDDVEE